MATTISIKTRETVKREEKITATFGAIAINGDVTVQNNKVTSINNGLLDYGNGDQSPFTANELYRPNTDGTSRNELVFFIQQAIKDDSIAVVKAFVAAIEAAQ